MSVAHADFSANGYVDSLAATPGGIFASGWACPAWYPNYSYYDTIEIYESGPVGSGTLVKSFNINQTYRPDTTSYCGGSWAYNGFYDSGGFFPIYSNQYYWVYIKDYTSGDRVLLAPSPMLACPYGYC